MTPHNLEQKCDHFYMARIQKHSEETLGILAPKTTGYDDNGCYLCDGYNKECPLYLRLADYNFILQEYQNLEFDNLQKNQRGE